MSIVTASDGMSRYKKLEKLGEGTYGLVYKAEDLTTGKFVAIKKIKLDNNEEGIPATTMREISLLSHLKHPNIVEMDGCLYVNGELCLVFEYMSCDLKGYLDSLPPNRYLSPSNLKKFTYYLCEGIRFCHTRRILHRDLKPQNILISQDKALKIADFGLGREHGLPIGELTHEVVTLWYRPPEILLGKKKYSGACDVWGIGCIMAEMATKVPLFPGDSEIDQLFQIYRIMGTPNELSWPGIKDLPEYKPVGPKWKRKDLMTELNNKLDKDGIDLLEKSLIYAPNKRITAKQMLNHVWFDEIREEMIEQFGNVYPHCGNKEYQLNAFNKQKELRKKQKQQLQTQNQNKENMESENVGGYNLRKRRKINSNSNNSNANNNDKNKNKKRQNTKKSNIDNNNKYEMNQDTDCDDDVDNINDESDDEEYDHSHEIDQDESEDEDDDDDITGNAEEWTNNNNYRSKLRSYNHSHNNNLSQPMDEDGEEE
mmetsp:Transcript_67919/g.61054  ORF Transcript_67919/g.61054 Transcript_67919/m.61054 type:complete len:483 (+) Transcript_67919:127-1575(+)